MESIRKIHYLIHLHRLLRLVIFPFTIALSFSVVSKAFATTQSLEIKLKPDPPDVGRISLEVQMLDKTSSLPDTLDLLVFMPAMGTMPYMEEKSLLKKSEDSVYRADFNLGMGGTWEVVISTPDKSQKRQWYYSLTTGIPGLNNKNIATKTESQGENQNNLTIGPDRLQKIGVRFAPAKYSNLTKNIRAVGFVEPDQTRRSEVTLRFAGYVEKQFKGRVGDDVQVGTPLFSVYSPDLITAQSEFLLVHKNTGETGLKESTWERLRNFGLTETDILRIKKAGAPERATIISAPQSGNILEISTREGASFSQGQTLYVIGDLSKNYITARIFQRDISELKVGQPVSIVLSDGDGKKFRGKIDLIFPNMNEADGTVNVRVVAEEAIPSLKTGVFVDIIFPVELGNLLVIPSSAVLFSGLHRYVFIDRGQGVLEPREIFTGRSTDDWVEVKEGLTEGEQVAASGTFLISSEAQLRSALPKWKSASNPQEP